MTRVTFEDHDIDVRSRDMLIAAREICAAPLVITQGGYNAGGVTASAGTHDGGGALDIRATNLSAAQRVEAVKCLRRVGFAAWLRTPAQSNWPYHIHCIAMGCPDASAGAKGQMQDFKDHRNGLASNGPDDGRPLYSGVTWESFAKGYFMSAAEVAELKQFIRTNVYAQPRYEALQNSINAANNALAAILPYLKTEDAADDAALVKAVADLKAAIAAPKV